MQFSSGSSDTPSKISVLAYTLADSDQDCAVESEVNFSDSAVQPEIEGEAVIVEDSVGKGIHESEKCSITATASASSAMATTDRTTSSTAKQVQVVQLENFIYIHASSCYSRESEKCSTTPHVRPVRSYV